MTHSDASREGTGNRVDRSRFSTNEPALTSAAVVPVDDLTEIEQKARDYKQAKAEYDAIKAAEDWSYIGAARMRRDDTRDAYLEAVATPERILSLVSQVRAGAEDTARLDALEETLWAGRCGNGLAFMPSTNAGTGRKRIDIIDLGDQDGSDLADEIASADTLRQSLDVSRVALLPGEPAR